MRKIITLPSLENVVAGNSCVLNCPLGLTYDVIYLKLTNITLAQLTNIEVRVNGKAVQEFSSGTIIDALNEYHGRRGFENGVLPLYFMRPEMVLPAEKRVTSIGTSDLTTFSIQADIDAACSSPTILAWAQLSAPQPLGVITKIRRFPKASGTSGEQEITSIPKLGSIGQIHFMKSDISEVLVKIDGREVWDLTKVVGQEVEIGKGKTPYTAGATHVDFMLDGMLQDALITSDVQSLSLRPTLDTSGAYDIIVEYLAGFNEG